MQRDTHASSAHEEYRRACDQADELNALGYYNLRPPLEVYPQAKAAATRAIEIDPARPEAHASLAFTSLFFDRAWTAAALGFRRSIELDAKYPSAHHWYASYFMALERFEEMIAAAQRAHTLDPQSPAKNEQLGYAYCLAKHDDFAMKQFQRALELDAEYPYTHWRIGELYMRRKQYNEAADSFRRATELTNGQLFAGYTAQALAMAGRIAEAKAALRTLEAKRGESPASPLEIALGYAGIADIDAVFEWLETATAERTSDLVRLKLLPWPDDVRSHPRFSALTAQLGLPAAIPK